MDAKYLHEGQMAALLVNIQHNYPMRQIFSRADHQLPYGERENYVVRADYMQQRSVNEGELTYLMNIDRNVMNRLKRSQN